MVNLDRADPLGVVVGVLVSGVSHDTGLRLEHHPSEGAFALADGVVGAGRSGRCEDGRHGKRDRGHSCTDDGPHSTPFALRCLWHFHLPWFTSAGYRSMLNPVLRTANHFLKGEQVAILNESTNGAIRKGAYLFLQAAAILQEAPSKVNTNFQPNIAILASNVGQPLL